MYFSAQTWHHRVLDWGIGAPGLDPVLDCYINGIQCEEEPLEHAFNNLCIFNPNTFIVFYALYDISSPSLYSIDVVQFCVSVNVSEPPLFRPLVPHLFLLVENARKFLLQVILQFN